MSIEGMSAMRNMCKKIKSLDFSRLFYFGYRSYNRNLGKKKERVMGIEPTYPAWKAGVLPLNYTRMCYLIYDMHLCAFICLYTS